MLSNKTLKSLNCDLQRVKGQRAAIIDSIATLKKRDEVLEVQEKALTDMLEKHTKPPEDAEEE